MTTAVQPAVRELRGPSAYGGGSRRFLHLTWLLAVTEFRLAYFGSALGYLWSLMRPLLFFGVLYAVFSVGIHLGAGVKDYPMVLLVNIMLFTFFAESTGNAVAAVVNREQLVRKMQFPRLVIPLSTVLTSLLNLATNLIAVFIFLLAYGIHPQWKWLLLPVLLLPLIAFACGVAMILSSLYVSYRDVAPIWAVFAQLLFYVTPVIWAINRTTGWKRQVVLANPLADILEQGRRWLVDPSAPGAVHAIGGVAWFAIPVAIFVVVCAFGLWIFNHEAPRIAERL